jgi:3-phenylpropionate/trans-cinnamate dioxygenase ferredoxin subunit
MSMAEFLTVATAADLSEGEMRAFEVGGRRVTVARVGGSLHAFDDTCTHRQCSLAEGDLEEATVTCPCHGSQFDVATGAVLHPPASEPVKTYPVRVEGDDLQVGT